MKFLVDLNLSPHLARRLVEADQDAVHCADLELFAATDERILAVARDEARVVVSADADFGTIARTRASSPSLILVRRTQGRRVEQLGRPCPRPRSGSVPGSYEEPLIVDWTPPEIVAREELHNERAGQRCHHRLHLLRVETGAGPPVTLDQNRASTPPQQAEPSAQHPGLIG